MADEICKYMAARIMCFSDWTTAGRRHDWKEDKATSRLPESAKKQQRQALNLQPDTDKKQSSRLTGQPNSLTSIQCRMTYYI